MIMQTERKILKTIGIMILGVLLGCLLLTLAFLVPVSENNKSASYAIMEKEGWYPAIPIVSASYDSNFHSFLPGVLDGGTDALMLRTALEPREPNVLRAALDMNGYDYYWHGYVAVLRPLLLLFDYGEIRMLNSMGQCILVFLLCLTLWRKKGIQYALLELTSYFLLMSLAMPFSLQFSWIFYIMMACTLYLIGGSRERNVKGIKLYWVFLAAGMLTSFFDLLTYPLYTWGIPIIWWLLLQEPDKGQLYYVKQVVYTGLWWILGYAGMWVGKFCLGSVILGRNIFKRAFDEMGLRLGVGTESLGLANRLKVLYTNWKHYEYKLFVLILAAWLLFVIIRTLRNGIKDNVKGKALALAGSSSLVWYFTLANHTEGHHFFTYRIYSIAVLAILAILVNCVGDGQQKVKGQGIRMLCVWGACGITACVLSLLAREDVFVLNIGAAYQQVRIQEGELCEMRFTPSFPSVKAIAICLDTNTLDGICRIEVLDEKEVLYEEEIMLNAFEESTDASIPVNWKLKKGKDYILRLSVENADGETALLVTSNQDMPLDEYGEVWVEGNVFDGQILSKITYSYRPLSYFTLVFLALTWTGILFAVYMVFVEKHPGRGVWRADAGTSQN